MINDIIDILSTRGDWFLELLLEHLRISLTAIVIAGILGLIIGIWISGKEKLASVIIGITNAAYTIPSIALLGMLIPLLGMGDENAITTLVIYGLLPMVRNTYAGLNSIDTGIVEAARGMGSTEFQVLMKIKLPLAMSIIIAGVRNMVVMTIAVTTIASYVGAGGLGVAIFRGISSYNPAMTFAASIMVALLALICDFLLGRVENHLKKERRMN